MSISYNFSGEIWRAASTAAWHFVTVPEHISKRIRAIAGGTSSSFGSIRVMAKVGENAWRTSIFPDSKLKAYLLPVKADIRRKQGIGHGDLVHVTIELDF